MPHRRKNLESINGHLARNWLGAACLILLVALMGPAWLNPAQSIMTGAQGNTGDIRAFSLLALGSERLLSPADEPASWPGYPRTTAAPGDTPGLIASLIAAPTVALGEPVAGWNLASLLVPWLTFVSMALLCRSLTGSWIAGGIAGLGYILQPIVLLEPTATFLLISPLIPLLMLAVSGVLTHQSTAGVVALGWGAITLALSPVPVAVATLAACTLTVGYRRPTDPTILGQLLAALLLFLIFKSLLNPELLFPTNAVSPALNAGELRGFLPGGTWGPGLIVTGLATIALLDRGRSSRNSALGDPRLFLLSIVVILPFLVADPIARDSEPLERLPGDWLEARYPIVNSLRWSLRLLLPLSWCLLAAFGALAILERLKRPGMHWATAAIFAIGIAAGNLLHPAQPLSASPIQIRQVTFLNPPDSEAELLGYARKGALLDLPTGIPDSADHRLLTAAWHRRATTRGSSDGQDAAQPLAPFIARITLADGAEALAALGFGTVLVHKHDLSTEAYENFLRALARGAGAGGRLATTFESPGHLLLSLRGIFPVSDNYDVLESNQPSSSQLNLAGPDDLLVFELKTRGNVSFRHPEPEVETPLRVEFFDFRGRLVSEHLTTGLLPLAVAPGGVGHVALRLPIPGPPGRYTARLAPQQDPSLTLAIQDLKVLPSGPSQPITR